MWSRVLMTTSLHAYFEEVVEMLCALEGCCPGHAHQLAEEKHAEVEYGYKHRLSPSVVAGSILGISGCCIPGYPLPNA